VTDRAGANQGRPPPAWSRNSPSRVGPLLAGPLSGQTNECVPGAVMGQDRG
jgi:hypothetical protein